MKKNALAAAGRPEDDYAAEIPVIGIEFPQLTLLDVRIAPNRIHFLKFILEGYDGLALLSTLDSRQGLVRLRFPIEVKDELCALLRDLGPQLGGVDWLNVEHEV